MSIRELIKAVERGDDEAAASLAGSVFSDPWHLRWLLDALRDDVVALGSALALMAAVLPGWGLSIWGGHKGSGYGVTIGYVTTDRRQIKSAKADTPARALLLAILQAMEGGK